MSNTISISIVLRMLNNSSESVMTELIHRPSKMSLNLAIPSKIGQWTEHPVLDGGNQIIILIN